MALWIDAIYINQESIAERNNQVRLMQRVYSQAVEVLIWLDSEDEDAETALRMAPYIYSAENIKSKKLLSLEKKRSGEQ